MAVDESARLRSLLAQLPTITTLLDLGCGTCSDVHACFAAGARRVCGVDWDWLALKAARRTHRSRALCLIWADVRAVAFAPHTFDAILIRHPDVVRAPQVWEAALANAARWLKATGTLLITTYSLAEAIQMRTLCASITLLRAVPLDEHSLVPGTLSGRDCHALCCTLAHDTDPRAEDRAQIL